MKSLIPVLVLILTTLPFAGSPGTGEVPTTVVPNTGQETDRSAVTKKWLVDTSHSNIGFTVNHLFTPVRGSFGQYSSDILFDPENLPGSSIRIEIQVTSISTANERRDNDLRSPNFFDAETWPAITFKSSRFTHEGGDRYAMTGELTIRDVTKTVTLPFTLLGMSEHYRLEGYDMAGISASTVIRRTDYGVGTGDWLRTNVVGDEVTVDIALELAHKREG